MKTIETHGSFNEALQGTSPEVTEIALKLRQLIVQVYPDVVEVPWPKQRIIGYGVGPKKMSEHFCYVGAHSKHVNLGFYYGAQLPDPGRLLEGTGQSMRHIKVRDAGQVGQPSIRSYIEASLAERKTALGIQP